MKKTLAIIILVFVIITFSVYGLIIDKNSIKRKTQKENKEYEYYLEKIISGTELATLINKVTDKNDKNKVLKDEKNYYIENNKNSIKIDITMIQTEKTYPMEAIYNNDVSEFVKYFNTAKFKCTKIEYHKETEKISKILFEQQEE